MEQSGYSGDGSSAEYAQLRSPKGFAGGLGRHYFISDTGNNVIRQVASDSMLISTVIGVAGASAYNGDGWSGTSTLLSAPQTMFLRDLTLYFVDMGSDNLMVRVVDLADDDMTVSMVGFFNATTVDTPPGMVCDTAGSLFVTNQAANSIQRFVIDNYVNRVDGSVSSFAGVNKRDFQREGFPAVEAWLEAPRAIHITSGLMIYLTDAEANKVYYINSDADMSTMAGNGLAGCFGDDGAAATSALLQGLTGLWVDPGETTLYFSDNVACVIRKVVLTGTPAVFHFAGIGVCGMNGNGVGPSAATSTQLKKPNGIWGDAAGNVFVADTYNHCIRKIVPSSGAMTVFAGKCGTKGYDMAGSFGKCVFMMLSTDFCC
jgi:sugar lactone lactonase YvrE